MAKRHVEISNLQTCNQDIWSRNEQHRILGRQKQLKVAQLIAKQIERKIGEMEPTGDVGHAMVKLAELAATLFGDDQEQFEIKLPRGVTAKMDYRGNFVGDRGDGHVHSSSACPKCGETAMDNLIIDDNYTLNVGCSTCGKRYSTK